jgi:hypothetical protein
MEFCVTFVSKIEEIFRITGRGFFIVPAALEAGVRLKAKDPIQLRTPDGQALDTHVVSIEFLSGPKVKGNLALLLPSEITEREVPLGTEIWLARDK